MPIVKSAWTDAYTAIIVVAFLALIGMLFAQNVGIRLTGGTVNETFRVGGVILHR